MVGYCTNSVSKSFLLFSILLLLLPWRETECFKTIKGHVFWKKSAVTWWGSMTIDHNTSAIKAAYSSVNLPKALRGRPAEILERSPISGSRKSPALFVHDPTLASTMLTGEIPVVAPEDGTRGVYNLYCEEFGSKPKCVVRAPGRVNIIGEHIDYMDFGVLPIALDVEVCMSAGFRTIATRATTEGPSIKLVNACPDFPSTQVPADPSAPMVHGWAKYFQAGYKGVIALAEMKGLLPVSVLKNGISYLQVMVKGNIPVARGLSSSAAMVTASALVVSEATGLRLSRSELCHLAINSERLAGVVCGGMDQTASVMGEEGAALYISFKPTLSVRVTNIPSGCSFVVADTTVKAEKTVSADHHYNKRVIECHLASILLAKDADGSNSNWKSTSTLYEAALAYAQGNAELMSSPKFLRDVAKSAARVFSNDQGGGTYSRMQLFEMLGGIDPIELLGGESHVKECVFRGSDDFHLKDRALHALHEAARVLDFVSLCSSYENEESKDEILLKLGRLMDESHHSCKELNHLQAAAKKAGAIGSRLTGAGWGGCIVSLVKDEHIEDFINAMKQQAKECAKLESCIHITYYGPNSEKLARGHCSNCGIKFLPSWASYPSRK